MSWSRARVAASVACSGARRGGWATRRWGPRCGTPAACLAVGLAVAALGWAVDSRTEVVSDIERLVPQDLPAVRDLEALQQATGVAGEVDVVVEGNDLTDPTVVTWMRDYQAGLLKRYGYTRRPRLRAGRAVPGAVAPGPVPHPGVGERPRADPRAARRGAAVLLQAVITADRKTANLAFGIRLASLERQQQIIDQTCAPSCTRRRA